MCVKVRGARILQGAVGHAAGAPDPTNPRSSSPHLRRLLHKDGETGRVVLGDLGQTQATRPIGASWPARVGCHGSAWAARQIAGHRPAVRARQGGTARPKAPGKLGERCLSQATPAAAAAASGGPAGARLGTRRPQIRPKRADVNSARTVGLLPPLGAQNKTAPRKKIRCPWYDEWSSPGGGMRCSHRSGGGVRAGAQPGTAARGPPPAAASRRQSRGASTPAPLPWVRVGTRNSLLSSAVLAGPTLSDGAARNLAANSLRASSRSMVGAACMSSRPGQWSGGVGFVGNSTIQGTGGEGGEEGDCCCGGGDFRRQPVANNRLC